MSAIRWEAMLATFGVWYWHAGPLPNGWTAQVSDVSQMYAPERATEYGVSASCYWWHVSHPRMFATLEEAKREAIRLAVMQGVASADPACRVGVPNAAV